MRFMILFVGTNQDKSDHSPAKRWAQGSPQPPPAHPPSVTNRASSNNPADENSARTRGGKNASMKVMRPCSALRVVFGGGLASLTDPRDPLIHSGLGHCPQVRRQLGHPLCMHMWRYFVNVAKFLRNGLHRARSHAVRPPRSVLAEKHFCSMLYKPS